MFDPVDTEASATEASAAAGDFDQVSGVVLAHLLSVPLADLTRFPDSLEGDAGLVDVMTGLARLEAWAVAQRGRVVAVLLERTRAELRRYGLLRHSDGRGATAGPSHGFDDDGMAERLVSTDISLALGISSWAADKEIELAEGLAAHPELGVALASGRTDRRRAELLLAEIAPVSGPLADAVIRSIVGDGTHGAEEADARAALIKELRLAGSSLFGLSEPELRRATRRECAALDPDFFADREAAARRSRQITWRSLPDAQCELSIQSSACAVAAAHTNIDQAARAARLRGDWRTLDQLRSDIAIGWLTEGAFGTLVIRPEDLATLTATDVASVSDSPLAGLAALPDPVPAGVRPGPGADAVAEALSDWIASSLGDEPVDRSQEPAARPVDGDDLFSVRVPRPKSALIVIAMAAGTGLGLDDQPATLFGPGGPMPIPAGVARDIAHDPTMATWLGLFTDPRTGIATDISPGYRAPPRLRSFVTLRDGLRSRLPSSQVRRVELDHVEAYDHERPARGGQTTAADLASVGLREHHLKTDGALIVKGNANGPLTFRTHTGKEYFSWPEVWETPVRFLEADIAVPTQRVEQHHGDPPF
jgi:hypothetical protein